MIKNNAEITVVAFVEGNQVAKNLKAALGSQSGFRILEIKKDVAQWHEVLKELRPHIILLDYLLYAKQKTLLKDQMAASPGSALVVIMPDDNAGRAQEVILEGATAFIVPPLEGALVAETLKRVDLLERKIKPVPTEDDALRRTVNTFTFFSSCGGVGCSTSAVNAAISLYQETGERVALFDGNQFFGQLDVHLNLIPQNTVADLVPHVADLSEDILQDVVTIHSSGIHVFPGPGNLIEAQTIKPDHLYKIIQALQGAYDYVLIDAGNSLSENAVTLLDLSFRIFVVVDPGLASLRGARQFADVAKSLNYSREKVLLLLNREDRKGGIGIKQLEKALNMTVFSTFPENADAFEAINVGIPMALRRQNSTTAKAIREFSKEIVRISNEGYQGALQTTGQSGEDTLTRSSQLG